MVLINGTTMLLGGIASLLTKLFVGCPGQPLWTEFWPTFGSAIILVIISNIAGYNMYCYLLKRYSITLLSLSGLLCPVFGALFSWLFLHELISAHYIVSFVGILAGICIFYADELVARA